MLRRTFLATPAAAFAASKASVFIFDPEVRDELAFPPTGRAYRENAVAHRIWRRILIQSPDLVIIVGDRDGGLEAALQSRSIPVRRAKTRALAERMRTVRLPKSTVHIAAESWQALPPREVATQLVKLLAALVMAEVNVHFAYPLLIRPRGFSAIARHVDDTDCASSVLMGEGFKILSQDDISR